MPKGDSVTIREFEERDYARVAELRNLWEPEPETAESLAEEDRRFDPKGYKVRWVAADADGFVVGYSGATHVSEEDAGLWWVSVTVEPEWRSQGIGGRLLDPALEFARSHQGTTVRDYFRETESAAIQWCEQLGMVCRERVFESVLDLATVERQQVAAMASLIEDQGLRLFTYASVMQEPDAIHHLHKINTDAERDMPGIFNGFERSFEAFEREIVKDPDFTPEATFIVADGDEWIGLSMLMVDAEYGWSRTTGVRSDYRGRGIAKALKGATVAWAKDRGLKLLRTNNHNENGPMLKINEMLGYRAEPGWLCYQLDLSSMSA